MQNSVHYILSSNVFVLCHDVETKLIIGRYNQISSIGNELMRDQPVASGNL